MAAEPPRDQQPPRLADDPDAAARAELALLMLEGARRLLRERERERRAMARRDRQHRRARAEDAKDAPDGR